MSHLQTTPTAPSKSTRPFFPSPPGPRRLAFGSSKKANAGYGIVSASGFSAWKRSVKRGSTSTHTHTTNTNTNKENTTIASGSNAFNRELEKKKKKGPGMGFEGTPARKRYKRDSRISKVCHFDQMELMGRLVWVHNLLLKVQSHELHLANHLHYRYL